MDVVASPALTAVVNLSDSHTTLLPLWGLCEAAGTGRGVGAVIKNWVEGAKICLVMSKLNCFGVSKLVGGSKVSYWVVLIFFG